MTKPKNYKTGNQESKVNKLKEIISDTEENIKDAEFSKEFSNEHEQQLINEKNNRRKHAVKALKQEIKEEL